MELSVIILNYNTAGLLKKCLESLARSSTSFEYEVIVSDNGSTDGSAEMVRSLFPKVRLIENGANLGFSKGNNVALKQAKGKYFLLLNSDTETQTDTLDLTVRYLQSHPEVGIMGCRVVLPDGTLDPSCRRRFPDPKNAFLRLFGLKKYSSYNISGPDDKEIEVDAVVGAFLAIPKTVTDKVGLLDEDFFMYGEDLDWCWRVKKFGYKVMYFPSTKITHFKYGSAQSVPFRTIWVAHNAMWIFYRKHYSNSYNLFFNFLVYIGIWFRMALVMILNLFRVKKIVH